MGSIGDMTSGAQTSTCLVPGHMPCRDVTVQDGAVAAHQLGGRRSRRQYSYGRDHSQPCTASELDAWSVSCGLARSAGWGKIAVRVCPPVVTDHDSALRVAGPPGAQP